MTQQHPVHVLAQLRIEDKETFMEHYIKPLQRINSRHEVEVVSASFDIDTIEGEANHNMTAILKFPSRQVFDAWYADEEYQPLIEIRKRLSDPKTASLICINPGMEVQQDAN